MISRARHISQGLRRAGLALAPALLALICGAGAAQAATCTAQLTDFEFGTVTLRAGASNTTSGNVKITCTNALVDAVGVCLTVGSGSGGAASGNSPRYLRDSQNNALPYELRLNGPSALNGTLNQAYYLVPVLLGRGSITVPIYAAITAANPSAPSGDYTSRFSGSADIKLEYGLLACGLLGQTSIPDPFEVNASVEASCEIDVGDMSFGEIPTLITSPEDAQSTVNVRCSQNTPYTITMDRGQHATSTDPERRKMKNGSHTLEYGLYQDAARSQPWGEDAGNDLNGTGAGLEQSFPVYGRIHSGQSAYLGTYTDSVIVTVNY